MNLNNKGWGTVEMLLLSGGLLIALLVAIFFISQLYGSLSNAVIDTQYMDLENKLENVARDYIEEQDNIVNGEYKISLYTLKSNGYITSFEDNNDNSCDGYVTVKNSDSFMEYKAYINCNDYQTEGY